MSQRTAERQLLTNGEIHEGYVLCERWFESLPDGVNHAVMLAMTHFALSEVLLRMVVRGASIEDVEALATDLCQDTIAVIRRKTRKNEGSSAHG